ncbi:type VII secretion system-associated protein [Streptomyces sp. NPDC093109]|uniref:type VII secretion system-associated protein n=1 Tax=Streptomyces sp. NPDC093109 TaxID=3154977 RepID=UPI0034500272
MPAIPDEIREAARLAPDHWLGMVDPTWKGEGAPPAWAVVGQWRSGLDGEIVEWQDNEEYRPSPTALGWPEPADDVDAAVQLAATGYGPGEDVTSALAELPEAAVFVTPGGDPLPATAPDGETPVVPLFTSPVHLHTSGRLAFALMPVSDVLDRLPEGHLLYLNPSAPVSMTVETDALREALAGHTAAQTDGTERSAEDEAEDDGDFPARPATTGGPADTASPSSGRKNAAEDVSSETAQGLL